MKNYRQTHSYRFLWSGRNLMAHLLCLLLVFSMPVLASGSCEEKHIETRAISAACNTFKTADAPLCGAGSHPQYIVGFDPASGCEGDPFANQYDPELNLKLFDQGAGVPKDQRNTYDMGIDPATLNPESLDLNIFPTFEISAELSLIPSLSYSPNHVLSRLGRVQYGPPKEWRNHYGEIVVMVSPTEGNTVPVGAPSTSSNSNYAQREPIPSELHVFYINASGQQVNFYPDETKMGAGHGPITTSGQVETWFSEDGSYRLEDLNAAAATGAFNFELRTSSGLRISFEPYKYHLDSEEESLARHFRVDKITDRYNNYVDVSYRDQGETNYAGGPTLQPFKVEGRDNAHSLLQSLTYKYDTRNRLERLILPAFGSGTTQEYEFLYLDSGSVKNYTLADGSSTNRLDLNNVYPQTISATNSAVTLPPLVQNLSGYLGNPGLTRGVYLNFESLGFAPESAVDFLEIFTSGGFTGEFRSASYLFHIADDHGNSDLVGTNGKARQISSELQIEEDAIRYRYKMDQTQYPNSTVRNSFPDFVKLSLTNSDLEDGDATISVLPRLKHKDLLAWIDSNNQVQTRELETIGATPILSGTDSYIYPLISGVPDPSQKALRYIRKDQRDRIAEIIYPGVSGSSRKRMLFQYAENSRNHAEIQQVLTFDERIPSGTTQLMNHTQYTYEHVLVQTAAEDLISLQDPPIAEEDWRNCSRATRGLTTPVNYEVTYGVNRLKRHEVIDTLRHKRVRTYEPGLKANGSFIPYNDYRDLETFYGGALRFALLGLSRINETHPSNPNVPDYYKTCDELEWGVAQKPFSFTWQINPDGSAQIFDLSADGVGLDPVLAYANSGVRVFKTYQFDTGFKAAFDSSDYGHLLGAGSSPFSPYFQYLPSYQLATSHTCNPCMIADLEQYPAMPSNRQIPTMADIFSLADTHAHSASIELFEILPLYGYNLLTDIHPGDSLKKLALNTLHGSIQQTDPLTHSDDKYYYRISAIHGIKEVAAGDLTCEQGLVDTFFRGLWTSEVGTKYIGPIHYEYDVPWTYGGPLASGGCFQYLHQRQKNHRLRPHAQIQLKDLGGLTWDTDKNILDLDQNGSHQSPVVVEATRYSNGGYLGDGNATAASAGSQTHQSNLTVTGMPTTVRAGDVLTYKNSWLQVVSRNGDQLEVKPSIANFSASGVHFYRFFDPVAASDYPYLGYDIFGNNAFKATYKRNELIFSNDQNKDLGKDHGLVPNFFDNTAKPFLLSLNDSTKPENNDVADWRFFGRVSRQFDTGLNDLGAEKADGTLTEYSAWQTGMLTEQDYNYAPTSVAYEWSPTNTVSYFLPVTLSANSIADLRLSVLTGASTTNHFEDNRKTYRYYSPGGVAYAFTGTQAMSHGRISLEWTGKSDQVGNPAASQFNATRYAYDSNGWLETLDTAVIDTSSGMGIFGTRTIYDNDAATGLITQEETRIFHDPSWVGNGHLPDLRLNFSGNGHLRSRTVTDYDLLGRQIEQRTYDANNQRFGPKTTTSYPSMTQTVTLTRDTTNKLLVEEQTFAGGAGQVLAKVRKREDDTQAYAIYSAYDDFGRLSLESVELEFPNISQLDSLAVGHADDGGHTKTLYNHRGEPFGTVTYNNQTALQASWILQRQDSTTGNLSTWIVQQAPDEEITNSVDPAFINVKAMHQDAYGQLTEVMDYQKPSSGAIWETSSEENLNTAVGTPATLTLLAKADYTYDRMGKVINADVGISSPIQTRTFTFDQRDRLREESHPEMDDITVVYDDFDHFDNPQTVEHRKLGVLKRGWHTTYDTAGNLLQWQTSQTPQMTTTYRYNYDVSGTPLAYPELPRAIRHQDEASRVFTYRHDYDSGRGILTGRSLFHNRTGFPGYSSDPSLDGVTNSPLPTSTAHLSYVYDALGRVETMIYPAPIQGLSQPTELAFAYGDHGLLSQVDDVAFGSTLTLMKDLTYGVNDQLTAVSFATPIAGNQNQLLKTYDPLNRLNTWQTHFLDGTNTQEHLRKYDYDLSGRIHQIRLDGSPTLGYSYAYDGLGQISQASFKESSSANTKNWDYTYDLAGFGNLVSFEENGIEQLAPTLTINLNNNRINADGDYTDLGELKQFTDGNDTVFNMDYNAMGRMTSLYTSDMDADYHYDHAGMRVLSKVEGSQVGLDQSETLYFYDADGMVLCEWVSEKPAGGSWSTPRWDRSYLYLAGKSSLTYEYNKSQGNNPPAAPAIPQPEILQDGLLSWTDHGGPYTVELADEHMQPIRTYQGLETAEFKFGKRLKYGKYQVRLKGNSGTWGPWQEIFYMDSQAQDLAGEYGFDQTGDDASYFRNHLSGIQSIDYSFGQYYDALELDAGETFTVENPHEFIASGSDGTFSVWLKIPAVTGLPSIVRRTLWDYHFISLWVNNYGGVEFKRKGSAYQAASVNITPDTWTHVAVVYGDGHAQVYINGQLALNALSIPPVSPLSDMQLGSNSAANGFTGLLDRIRIFNRGLSVSEIQTEATP